VFFLEGASLMCLMILRLPLFSYIICGHFVSIHAF
jgi:hypothetical protein